MADHVDFDLDAEEVLAAFKSLPATVHTFTLAAAQTTAENIAREARSRVPRRRGKITAAQAARPPLEDLITVLPMRNGTGYVVIVQDPAAPFLPWQLEYGTEHMTKRDFFFPSARLERSSHERRMHDAVQQAIDTSTSLRMGDED